MFELVFSCVRVCSVFVHSHRCDYRTFSPSSHRREPTHTIGFSFESTTTLPLLPARVRVELTPRHVFASTCALHYVPHRRRRRRRWTNIILVVTLIVNDSDQRVVRLALVTTSSLVAVERRRNERR